MPPPFQTHRSESRLHLAPTSLLQVASQDKPPLRFAAGADAVATFEITLILTGPAHLHVAHDYSPDAACLQVLKELGRTWKRS